MPMYLSELLKHCHETVTLARSAGDVWVEHLVSDSRRVTPGALFAALSGAREGSAFVPQAVENGAVAVLLAEADAGDGLASPSPACGGTSDENANGSLPLEGGGLGSGWGGTLGASGSTPTPPSPLKGEGVSVLTAPNPRRVLAYLSAAFYAPQPEHVVAVTGTDGKTSTVDFTRQLLEMRGMNAASLGTIGARSDSLKLTLEATHTTPDPITLHKQLQQLAQAGAQAVAMEASSHGLDQHRLDGVRLSAAAFTNLGRDHLDYHTTLEEYFRAKRRLFADLLPEGGVAAICAEDARAPDLIALAQARGHRLVDYGKGAGVLNLLEAMPVPEGLRLSLALHGRALPPLLLSLMGGFQALNALAACGLAYGCGLALEELLPLLPRLQGVRGRMECAGVTPEGASAIVDYAHTPRALETALRALRPHARGKLWVVFGCGGDRDAGKRPLMGQVAAQWAEGVIVTDDNPRSEDPAAIRAAVMAGCPDALEVGDRAEAIALGLQKLGAGDVLLIAGKGHETTQTIGAQVLPFDDAAIVRARLAHRAAIA